MTSIETATKPLNGVPVNDARRLSPLSLLVRLMRLAPQMLIAIIAIGLADGANKPYWILPVFIGVSLVVAGGYYYLRWWRFSYRLTSDELRIESGILSRNARSIPYERIQDVNIEQKLLLRLFGLASVKIETGSGGGDDGVLNYVTFDEAEHLRQQIRTLKAGVSDPDVHTNIAMDDDQTDTAPIFAMDLRRVLTAGFFNFSLVIFAVLGAGLQNLDFLIPDQYFDPRRWLALATGQNWISDYGMFAQIAGILIAIVGLVLLGIVTGVVRTLFRDYGFRLDRTDNGFRRRRGLTTLSDVAMPLRRIQSAIIGTGPIRKYFGFYSLKFQSLASDGKNGSNHMAAPLAYRGEIDAILAEPRLPWRLAAHELQHVSKASWFVPAAMIAVMIALAIAVASALVDSRIALALIALFLAIPIAYFSWFHHRFALYDGQLYVHRGFWKQRLTILPLPKIQSVDIAVGPITRMFGHAKMVLGVAGGSGIAPLNIYGLEYDQAIELRARLLR